MSLVWDSAGKVNQERTATLTFKEEDVMMVRVIKKKKLITNGLLPQNQTLL